MVCVVLQSCVPAMETALTAFEFYTKPIGWKVSQHVVPEAVMGHALPSSLPSDSQEPNLGGADFHSIVPGLPYSAILFPVEQEVLPAAVPSTVN